MIKKILIVEDQFVEANELQLMLENAGYEVCGIARSVPIAQELIKKEKPGLVLLDIFLKGKQTGINLARQLNEMNIAFIYLSANSNEDVLNLAKATQPHGFLVKPYREKDLLIMLEIARYKSEHNTQSVARNETVLNDKLSVIISSSDTREKKLLTICKTLQSHISFDYITFGFNRLATDSSKGVSFLRIGFDEYQKIGINELSTISHLKSNELIALSNTAEMYQLISDTFGMKSCTSWPLYLSGIGAFVISFYSHVSDSYNTDNTGLLTHLKSTMADVIESTFGKAEAIAENKSRLSHISKDTFDSPRFEAIIGKSPLLLNVLDLTVQVAPSDTSVLILGESGTGKERIADHIHNLSSRKGRPFIKVNCATLPATLIESELFGHEKGSFTGAIRDRTGKFQQANGGTIFLDEIGEMSGDLQVKLLRVLQEKEIEPIGGSSPIKIDVRVIAATNRNLEKEVAERRFRLDLYYRLNVFPIELPPLRERTEDIPALVNHFLTTYNKKLGKNITGLSNKVMKRMKNYSWPGNIRELEHLIERGVLLAKGKTIENLALPAADKTKVLLDNPDFYTKTINENERDHIIKVLKKCDGRIWGPGGAAELLNVPPTTLSSKMKKLGIKKNL